MTHVNELNERTRNQRMNQRIRDDFGALLIAVYRLPLEQRKIVLEQFEKNRRTAIAERIEETKPDCETCNDEHCIEVLGDGDNFEVDVIGYKPCPDCKWEDPIQD